MAVLLNSLVQAGTTSREPSDDGSRRVAPRTGNNIGLRAAIVAGGKADFRGRGAGTARTTCANYGPPTGAGGARLEPSAQWLTDIVSPRRVCYCIRRRGGGLLAPEGKRPLYSYVRFAAAASLIA